MGELKDHRLFPFSSPKDPQGTYFEVNAIDFYSGIEGSVELDPEISEAIKIFNDKGFGTVASCAGHEKTLRGKTKVSPGYIWFSKFPTGQVPRFFELDAANRLGGTVLRWKPKNETALRHFHKALLNWARSL